MFKLCTKFEQNRLIHGWVIDALARFRRAKNGVILGGGTLLQPSRATPDLFRFNYDVMRSLKSPNVSIGV